MKGLLHEEKVVFIGFGNMEVFNDLDVSFEKVALEDRVKCIKCIKGN